MHPSTFYKYLSPERIDVLQNLRIRFTQVSALNDPFESYPGVLIGSRDWYLNIFRARIEGEMNQLSIRSEAKRKQYWRTKKNEFEHFHKCYTDVKWLLEQSELVQHMSDTVQGCLSLSVTASNILMWSHYAQNHTGYVLGFYAEHDYFGGSVDPVNYSGERPLHNHFEHKHSGELFYAKSLDWSYEQEYRKFQSFVKPIMLPNGNSFLPYLEPTGPRPINDKVVLFPFPLDAVACVIVGWKASSAFQAALKQALAVNKLDGVPIYRARPSLTKYEMEVVAL